MNKINLTENEKWDIIKYLELGKPLPDKYRFLLFEDKKEVELVWNGETSEVTNVVLPFQTIEVVDEPRAENTGDTKKETDFVELIVKAYKAEAINNFRTFVAKKAGRLVAIGPINLPASRLFVEEVIKECIEKQITKVDILSFEYEMGLFPNIQEEAKAKGIDLALKHIPREVFDKRAIEKNQIQFHDVSCIEVKPHVKSIGKRTPKTVAIELTDLLKKLNGGGLLILKFQLILIWMAKRSIKDVLFQEKSWSFSLLLDIALGTEN